MDSQELIEFFRKNGLKVTSQRLAICKYILSRKDHPTVDQIYQELIKEYPTISMGTLYKTLHLLNKLGLVQELNFSEVNVRYDPNMELHINIICSKCGKMSDYNAENIKEFWHAIMADLDIKPTGQRIDIYYECNDCK